MKILVFSCQVGARTASMNVATRNAVEIAKLLGADRMVWHTDRVTPPQDGYDAIIVPYFNQYTNYPLLRSFMSDRQARVVLRTEYEQVSIGSFFEPWIDIANFDREGKPNVNLNLLMSRLPNKAIRKSHGVVYYGRMREDRTSVLSKYYAHLDFLSTSTKNIKRWKSAGIAAKFTDILSWEHGRETLNAFRYSLYAEDTYTNGVFNNLANRWYEAGVCNAVVLFDRACLNTLSMSELSPYMDEVMRYVVDDGESMRAKIAEMEKDWPLHLATQKAWRANEPALKAAMIEQVRELIATEVGKRKEPIFAL